MTDGRTADARLERLLHLMPAAMRDEGVELGALAETLDTSVERLVEDIDELTARAYYQPGGWTDDVQIIWEGSRVRVERAPGFERPVRLSREETLCLALALRGGASSARLGEAEARDALLSRAERHLAAPVADASATLVAPEREADPEGIRETLIAAVRERRPCAIWYVRPGAPEDSVRVVHPYAVAYGDGAWYTIAHCTREEGVRLFRLDRVLACDVADGAFSVPEDFRAGAHLDGGRVFVAPDTQPMTYARVRYSPRVARWVRERAEWERERLEDGEDGAVTVRYDVADPHWLVGQVMAHGPEAEVVEPPAIRDLVRDAAERCGAETGADAA